MNDERILRTKLIRVASEMVPGKDRNALLKVLTATDSHMNSDAVLQFQIDLDSDTYFEHVDEGTTELKSSLESDDSRLGFHSEMRMLLKEPFVKEDFYTYEVECKSAQHLKRVWDRVKKKLKGPHKNTIFSQYPDRYYVAYDFKLYPQGTNGPVWGNGRGTKGTIDSWIKRHI